MHVTSHRIIPAGITPYVTSGMPGLSISPVGVTRVGGIVGGARLVSLSDTKVYVSKLPG